MTVLKMKKVRVWKVSKYDTWIEGWVEFNKWQAEIYTRLAKRIRYVSFVIDLNLSKDKLFSVWFLSLCFLPFRFLKYINVDKWGVSIFVSSIM